MQEITTVVEDREEFKTEKSVLLKELHDSGIDDIKTLRHNIAEMETTVARLADSERQSVSTRDEAVSQVMPMSTSNRPMVSNSALFSWMWLIRQCANHLAKKQRDQISGNPILVKCSTDKSMHRRVRSNAAI